MTKNFRKIGILVIALIILLILTSIIYLTNANFKQMVNITFNSIDQHSYTVNNKSNYLPLPAKTAFSYRTSDTNAVYITKSSVDEIVDFYSKIAENEPLIEQNQDGNTRILFQYQGFAVEIIVEEEQNDRRIVVSIV